MDDLGWMAALVGRCGDHRRPLPASIRLAAVPHRARAATGGAGGTPRCSCRGAARHNLASGISRRFVRGRAPVLLRAGAMRANGVRATAGGGESSLWQDAELLARHGEASVHWRPGKKEARGASPTAGRLADFPSRYREDEL